MATATQIEAEATTDEQIFELFNTLDIGEFVLFAGEHAQADRTNDPNEVIEAGTTELEGQPDYHRVTDADGTERWAECDFVTVETPRGAVYRLFRPIHDDEALELGFDEFEVGLELKGDKYPWLAHYGPVAKLVLVTPVEFLGLTAIDGIGAGRADKLAEAGIESPDDLAEADLESVKDALGFKQDEPAAKLIAKARELLDGESDEADEE